MAIPNPNPNIADGIKCDNKTYSSNKIEALISTATELPIPEAGDEGKVLTVNSDHDGYELDTPVDPTSIIDDSASSETTVYSSDKVDDIESGLDSRLDDLEATTISIAKTEGAAEALPVPNIKRAGNVILIGFFTLLPIGTYTSSTPLWTVSVPPSVSTRAVLKCSNNFYDVYVSSSNGEIHVNGTIELATATYLTGEIVYII